MPMSILSLPHELHLLIFTFVCTQSDPSTACSLLLTCRTFYSVFSHNKVTLIRLIASSVPPKQYELALRTYNFWVREGGMAGCYVDFYKLKLSPLKEPSSALLQSPTEDWMYEIVLVIHHKLRYKTKRSTSALECSLCIPEIGNT